MERDYPFVTKRKREEDPYEDLYETAFLICSKGGDIEILKNILRIYGLSTGGTKKELCDRIARRLLFHFDKRGYEFEQGLSRDLATITHFELESIREGGKEEIEVEEIGTKIPPKIREKQILELSKPLYTEWLPPEVRYDIMLWTIKSVPCKDLPALARIDTEWQVEVTKEIQEREKQLNLILQKFCGQKEPLPKEKLQQRKRKFILLDCAERLIKNGNASTLEEIMMYYCSTFSIEELFEFMWPNKFGKEVIYYFKQNYATLTNNLERKRHNYTKEIAVVEKQLDKLKKELEIIEKQMEEGEVSEKQMEKLEYRKLEFIGKQFHLVQKIQENQNALELVDLLTKN